MVAILFTKRYTCPDCHAAPGESCEIVEPIQRIRAEGNTSLGFSYHLKRVLSNPHHPARCHLKGLYGRNCSNCSKEESP